MDTKRQELVVVQELDREKKEIYKMTMEAKENLQKFILTFGNKNVSFRKNNLRKICFCKLYQRMSMETL